MQFACPVFSGLGDGFVDRGTQRIEDLVDVAFGKEVLGLSMPGLLKRMPPAAGAVHYRFWQWEKAYDDIKKRRREGGPIAVCAVGHSFGSWACSMLARALSGEGIRVQYLGCIDPTALSRNMDPMWIPFTVDAVDEFWSTRWFFNFPLAARRRDPTGRAGGKMMYRPGAPKPTIFNIPTGHIGTASHKGVHDRIISQISGVLDTID